MIEYISTFVFYLFLFLLAIMPIISLIGLIIMAAACFRGELPEHDRDTTDNPETGHSLFSPVHD